MKSRLASALALAGLLGLAGCERGCLSSWFRGQGIDQAASVMGGKGNPLAPTDTPCPSGLARCTGGVVRVSRSFTPPAPCSPEGCKCPWDDAKTCEQGCALEAIELEMPREAAIRQLCAPAQNAAGFARPATGNEAVRPAHHDAGEDEEDEAICDVERHRCVDGVVIACQGGPHPVGVCSEGCADGERMIFADTTDPIAIAILCKR
jgi:hypothetical protein